MNTKFPSDVSGDRMSLQRHRKRSIRLTRVRNTVAQAFVFGVLGMAVILFPLALTSGSVKALWYF